MQIENLQQPLRTSCERELLTYTLNILVYVESFYWINDINSD